MRGIGGQLPGASRPRAAMPARFGFFQAPRCAEFQNRIFKFREAGDLFTILSPTWRWMRSGGLIFEKTGV